MAYFLMVCGAFSKNSRARYYPIADLEEEFLRRLKSVDAQYYPESPFLFPADSKNGCITNNMVYQFFAECAANWISQSAKTGFAGLMRSGEMLLLR